VGLVGASALAIRGVSGDIRQVSQRRSRRSEISVACRPGTLMKSPESEGL
jgi:hypothetical protein